VPDWSCCISDFHEIARHNSIAWQTGCLLACSDRCVCVSLQTCSRKLRCQTAHWPLTDSSVQESAFRSAAERFATASEASQTLLKRKSEALEAGQKAMEALQAARTQAAAARVDLDSLASKMEAAEHKYEGVAQAFWRQVREIFAVNALTLLAAGGVLPN
jgi:hypothetical protein